ncbi:GNAT family N-acetyltransferase [Variovorax sp. J31P179]|jgi:ribosomal protein S18 acetylase RimI-like enzyme|uniref:GNAT family N-acetyltransferase n=1 Tax=Variovorax sp. J31P179 TaxID=3053508 RepID=UPI002578C082|nr:GNAT family N-acetyltransferase [Variovorax sp. J31P179]MDM0079817.1 GNAT family N-acetyltransferase [Variovorax sp. J31P179]
MNPLLDNIAWNTLSGPHAGFATGTDRARRYAPGFSPIVGFANAGHPELDDLTPFCAPGDHFYCMDWSGSAPAGWRIDLDSTMFRMVWQGAMPDDDPALDATSLRPEHAAQAVELAALTRPGPFGPRTPELGDYFGCFEGDRLIAMAGERMCAGTLREISGICTHPDYQGRGLARRLAAKLIRRQLQRGETPFLHVMRDNEGAHGLYQRMGFKDHREVVVRVISPC